jgi:hypothetical protein
VVVGTTVVLDGSESTPVDGVTYNWSITNGALLATLSDATSPVASLVTSQTGAITVSLTVASASGQTATASTTLNVTLPVTAAAPSGGHGGGAMELGWLLGWLASVIGVWAVTPRPASSSTGSRGRSSSAVGDRA